MKKAFSLIKNMYPCLKNVQVKGGVASFTDLNNTFMISHVVNADVTAWPVQAPDGLYALEAWDNKKKSIDATLKSATAEEDYPIVDTSMPGSIDFYTDRPVDNITEYCLDGEGRYVLCGVYLSPSGDLAATDGKRLIVQKVYCRGELPRGYIVPREAIEFMLRNTKKNDVWSWSISTSEKTDAATGEKTREADGKKVTIRFGNISVHCACIEGDFPQYEKFFTEEKPNDDIIIVNAGDVFTFEKRKATVQKAYGIKKNDFKAVELRATQTGDVVAVYRGAGNKEHHIEMPIGSMRDNRHYARLLPDTVNRYAKAQLEEKAARDAYDTVVANNETEFKRHHASVALAKAESNTARACRDVESGTVRLTTFNMEYIADAIESGMVCFRYTGNTEAPLIAISDRIRVVMLPMRAS